MLISKKVTRVSFVPNVLLVNLLLVLSVNSQNLEGEGCELKNKQPGVCTLFSDCPSAIQLSKNGIRPVICSFRGTTAIVCCNNARIDYQPVDNDRIESIFDVQRVYQSAETNYSERKKHSVDKDATVNDYPRRKYVDNSGHVSHKQTSTYHDGESKYRPERKPTPYVEAGSYEESHYSDIPKKRKQWIDPKATNHYQFEQVTKKPSWAGQENEENTKRNEWGENHETTKRRPWLNQENLETTKTRPWYSQGGRPTAKPRPWNNQENQETTKARPWDNQETRETTRGRPWNGQENRETTKVYERETTKRNEWSHHEPRETTKVYDHYNQQTTKRQTRPSQGSRETSTRRTEWQKPDYNNQNHWSIEENTADSDDGRTTTRRLYHQTTTRRPYYQTTTKRPYYQTTTRREHLTQEQNLSYGPNRPTGTPVKRRISEIKCIEYAQEVTETIAGLPLMNDPRPVKINVQKCIHPQQLIVGGENTTVGEFPHMAAVGFRDDTQQAIAWNCGGSLISEQFVMTAAHCTRTSFGPPVVVRLGEYNLKRNDDGAHPVDYSVIQIINHPDYRPPAKYNDIALLKLSRRVTFLKHIRPACLYTRDIFSTTKTVATGWGRIDYAEDPSDVLLKVTLSIIENPICNRLYQNIWKTNILSRGITSSQMCAGELAGGKDTCQGDSGGPIEITSMSNQCVHHIIGITSFGKHCAQPNAPGVYTRVSAFVPWVESIVWPQNE